MFLICDAIDWLECGLLLSQSVMEGAYKTLILLLIKMSKSVDVLMLCIFNAETMTLFTRSFRIVVMRCSSLGNTFSPSISRLTTFSLSSIKPTTRYVSFSMERNILAIAIPADFVP